MKQHDKALADYNRSIELDPDSFATYNNRGYCYRLQEDFARAMPDYDRSLELNPDCGAAYYNRGIAFYHFSNYDKALADYTSALEKGLPAGKQAALHCSLGHVWFMKNEHDKAICCYSKAIALDAGNSDYYKNRAEVHEYDDNDDLAAADYSQAIALDPANADLYMRRGAVQFRRRRFLASLADLWRGVKLILAE